MKKQFLSLGKVLGKAAQKSIKGGGAQGESGTVHCVTEDPYSRTSSIQEGPCDPNSIGGHEIYY